MHINKTYKLIKIHTFVNLYFYSKKKKKNMQNLQTEDFDEIIHILETRTYTEYKEIR